MQKKFDKIKKLYDEFHINMLSKGRLMLKDTGRGYWGITPTTEIFELFQKTKLKTHKRFLDLGSGDGRAAIVASIFTNSTGIEFDNELHHFALEHAKKLNAKVKLINQDYMEHTLKNYDYIFIAPDNPISEDLENKLLQEMSNKAKLIVYGPHYHPKELNKIETHDIKGSLVSVFKK
ncbi:MAG: rRNA adenine N-6-methyltransferase family protein [Candidatus Woesearchaeota archaeon]